MKKLLVVLALGLTVAGCDTQNDELNMLPHALVPQAGIEPANTAF